MCMLIDVSQHRPSHRFVLLSCDSPVEKEKKESIWECGYDRYWWFCVCAPIRSIITIIINIIINININIIIIIIIIINIIIIFSVVVIEKKCTSLQIQNQPEQCWQNSIIFVTVSDSPALHSRWEYSMIPGMTWRLCPFPSECCVLVLYLYTE